MAGRPTLLDDEKRRAKALDALRLGANLADAAHAGGVCYDTLREYLLALDEEDATELQSAISATFKEARAARHLTRLEKLNDWVADKENPMASIRALELGFRMDGKIIGQGGPSVAIDLGEDGRPTRIRASSGGEVAEMSDDAIAAELAGVEK